MEEKLITIATQTFGLSPGELTMDSTPDNTTNWDSLRHMRLILEVEDQFDIELSEDELVNIIDMKSLAATVSKHVR